MKHKRASMWLLALLPFAGCATTAQEAKPTAEAPARVTPRQPRVETQQFTLDNGLRVVISERHRAPVYALAITYNVGSRNEPPGKTGYAHLFEHMMFQGSENVGKAEHFILISNNGGQMNGSTSFDRTNYFETLPANQLELGLFLESDRMRSLDISQENLDNQREAVKEERRMRYDNRPYGTVMERLIGLTFDNYAYKHSTIGSMEDLDAATIEDIKEFFRLYYAPNNAVLTLVGDVNTQEALELIRKYFGDIPSQPTPPTPDLTEKINKGERRDTFHDPLAPMARVDMMYPTVPGDNPDVYPLEIVAQVLGGGESSRLYQRLVKQEQLAVAAHAFVLEMRGAFSLWVLAVAAPGKDPADVEKAIDEEIARMQQEPISSDELNRAKTRVRSQLIDWLSTCAYTAIVLGEVTTQYDDPDLVNKWPGLYQAVTVDAVQRVAQTYLNPVNRGVLTTVPARSEQPAPTGNE